MHKLSLWANTLQYKDAKAMSRESFSKETYFALLPGPEHPRH